MTDTDNQSTAELTEHVPGVLDGEILAGKYRVERVLGTGGMGAVVAARHLQLDTRVAIKFLRPHMLENEEVVARFAREARSAFRINSEHVARIFDVGTLDTGVPYMVMEYLDGTDLGTLLAERGPLPIEQAVDFLLQACEAVAEAHALGIVHRDLKPTNLFCVARPGGRCTIKVLDFGISKVTPSTTSPQEKLTQPATLMGTPLYMSPEQLEAPDTVDSRTDIWALGIVLYELLTAQMPFMGHTLPQVSVKIAVRAPSPLREFRADAPEALARVINTCLAKNRESRYQSVAELVDALLPFGPNRTRPAMARNAQVVTVQALVSDAEGMPSSLGPSTQTLPPGSNAAVLPRARASRNRGLALAALGALILAGITVSGIGSRRGPARSEAATQSLVTPLSAKREPPSAAAAPVLAGSLVSPSAAPARASSNAPNSRLALASTSARVPAWKAAAARSLGSISSKRAPPNEPAATRAAPQVSCDPTFEVDDQGRKHFKPECLKSQQAAPATVASVKPGCNPNFDFDAQGRKRFKRECFVAPTP